MEEGVLLIISLFRKKKIKEIATHIFERETK